MHSVIVVSQLSVSSSSRKMSCDKLVNLSIFDLEELESVLRRYGDRFEIWYRTVQNYLNWLRVDPDIVDLQIISLNGNWRNDGTFVIIDCSYIYLHNFKENNDSLERILHLLSWKRSYFICMFPERLKQPILNTFRELQIEIALFTDDVIYYLPANAAECLELDIPEGYRLGSLERKHVKQINAEWEFSSGTESERFIDRLIMSECNVTIGLFNESNHQLVGWCLQSPSGELSLLSVDRQHRRKGFGSLLVTAFAKQIAAAGLGSYACVLLSNHPSRKVFSSLGFYEKENVHWILSKPKQNMSH
ncbi:uncharacterized protein LOC131427917 [Malaya genurostris]|uniref:uncharacterized protein LOC131427917 n=1 Tax=Malaya genurostris TaxID=325434 RepID=UPI0026F3DEDA|nr:uncharacterized protein LOC131427917 [Malaya genurostris]